MFALRPSTAIVRLLVLAAGVALHAHAQDAREVCLTIGPEWSVVREVRDVAFAAAETDLVISVPAAADLTTLNVTGRRSPVRLLSWSLAERPAAFARAPALRATSSGFETVSAEAVSAGPLPRVRCRLSGVPGRSREVEIFYRTRDLSWRCQYEITVRGDVANYLEPLSLDMDCRVVLSNATARSFSDARVMLVAEDPAPQVRLDRARAAPGLLMLDDDSPLADLWRHQPEREGVSYDYALPQSVTLPAHAAVMAPWVTVRRKPAERLYSLDAEEFEIGSGSTWRPLRRFLTFRNEAGFGLGQPLPSGPALIYLGAVRGALYQRAWIPHTAVNSEIRIDLGPATGVTGTRRSQGRNVSAAGFTEETVDIQVANALPSAVNVELVERPPVPLAWDVTRSSRPYELRDRRLLYRLQVDTRSEEELSYTVRVTEPEQ